MFRTLTPRQLGFDVALASVCFVLRAAIGIGFDELPMFLVLAAMAAALGLRRASPALALAIAWFGAIVQVGTGMQPDVCNLAILPVLYATAAYGNPTVKWLGLASSGLGALVIAVYSSLGRLWFSPLCSQRDGGDSCTMGGQIPGWVFSLLILFLLSLTVFVLSWTFGLLARTWRKARDSSRARAIAERQRVDAQQDVVVEQERNRIARDMHDVVAHSLAVVIAQADGARYARVHDPDAVDAALTTIASTAREALNDVRILLAQLRHSQGESPQPVLADLERLFEQLRSSGLRIVVEEEGEPMTLAAGQQLAVYRIAQEALTNALRHGDVDADVTVRFAWSAERVELTVTNGIASPSLGAAEVSAPVASARPGTPSAGETAGHGLAGMRERAVLWGGTLQAAAHGQSYTLRAMLPIPERKADGS